jgi:hypothetical protein
MKEYSIDFQPFSRKLTKKELRKLNWFMWQYKKLISSLERAWTKKMITCVDADTHAMARLLSDNKKILLEIGVISEERFDTIFELLNLMNRYAWSRGFNSHTETENLIEQINAIKVRLERNRLCPD